MRRASLAWAFAILLLPSQGQAQAVLRAATQLGPAVDEALMVLRPEAELVEFSEQVANVLELRTGARVEVGAAPPPGLLEAVPAGHVALAMRDGHVVLVVGTAYGTSLEAHLPAAREGEALDTRAVALALEALRDAAFDREGQWPQGAGPLEVVPDGAEVSLAPSLLPGATSATVEDEDQEDFSDRLRDDGGPHGFREPPFLEDIEPFVFVRSYSGASSSSRFLEVGIATGVGLCAVRQCLVLTSEVPLTSAAQNDLRYRYVTFSSLFYSRPFTFGAWTPGASVGFLTRVGHFEADMGLPDGGLDTDLGVRASLDLAYQVLDYLDVMAEAGADIALDRLHRSNGNVHVRRGERVSPWLQLALRLRNVGE